MAQRPAISLVRCGYSLPYPPVVTCNWDENLLHPNSWERVEGGRLRRRRRRWRRPLLLLPRRWGRMREREGEAKASISFSFFFRVFGWPPVTGTGISRYRYRHRHPVPDRYRIHPVPYPVPTLIRYRHPELDDGFGYWIPVIGYRYCQIPVPDDGPDDDRRTLVWMDEKSLLNILKDYNL